MNSHKRKHGKYKKHTKQQRKVQGDSNKITNENGPEDFVRILGIYVQQTCGSGMHIGAALYDAMENSLKVIGLLSVLSKEEFVFVIEKLKQKTEPSIVVLSATMDSALRQAIEASEPFVSTRSIVSTLFDRSTALRMLEKLGFSQGTIRAHIDLDNEFGMRAIGGVLYLADKMEFLACGTLTKIELLNLDDFLLIDAATLASLHVIRQESHPSVIRDNDKQKHGYSLLTLLESRVQGVLGKQLLSHWVRHPLANADLIDERLEAVGFLQKHLHDSEWKKIQQNLGSLRDMGRLLYRVRIREASCGDWIQLAESVSAIIDVMTLMNFIHSSRCMYMEEIQQCRKINFDNLVESLGYIDWDETTQSDWLTPRANVSQNLDQARLALGSLDELCTRLESDLQARYPSVCPCTMEFFPILGFLVCTDQVPRSLPDDFEAQFQERHKYYFKCRFCDELNDRLGDVYGRVREEEFHVVRKVEEQVLLMESDLFRVSLALAQLDVLMSFAMIANDFSYTKPVLSQNSFEIEIRNGVHPLQVHSVEQYVPNSLTLSNGVSILTGPNYSGKSATMKMVALISILAQIGSWVPAEYAKIGIVDRVFTRIEAIESCTKVQGSSFALELQQICNMLNNCTPRSLLLIDEFGSGTLPFDGASLLLAIIQHLANAHAPRTLLTTHFDEVSKSSVLLEPPQCDFVTQFHMSIMFPANEQPESAILNIPIPLFKCVPSQASTTKSYGLECALRCNVPLKIVQRASQILSLREMGIAVTNDYETDAMILEIISDIRHKNWNSENDQAVADITRKLISYKHQMQTRSTIIDY